jgi:hypothetical protein
MAVSNNRYATQIDEVIRDRFGLDIVEQVVRVELVFRSNGPEKYDRIRQIHEDQLATRQNADQIRRRSYMGDSFAVFLECVFPRADIEGIPEDLSFHYPVCSIAEIARIHRPRDAWDSLLTIRAEAIVDDARLTRVFLARRRRNPEKWSLTHHFDRKPIEDYLALLSEDDRIACKQVAAGMAFIREPNGACIRMPLGDVIIVSESLQPFLYYMNGFLFYRDELPSEDAVASLVIAIKTMLMTESLDFDIDPRGDFPPEIHARCNSLVDAQMQFVIGHEFAHLLLRHLDSAILGSPPLGVMPAKGGLRDVRYYTPRQQQEFEADAGALLQVEDDEVEVARMLSAATCFFLCLEVLHSISEYINPRVRAPKTHPDPLDRIAALRKVAFENRLVADSDTYSEEEMATLLERIGLLKQELLKEFIPFHVDELENYGSIYLPTYRKEPLFDRIDF